MIVVALAMFSEIAAIGLFICALGLWIAIFGGAI